MEDEPNSSGSIQQLIDERLRVSLQTHKAEIIASMESVFEKISGTSNCHQLSQISNIISGHSFKRKSNEEQFKYNSKVNVALEEADHLLQVDKQFECRQKIAEGKFY